MNTPRWLVQADNGLHGYFTKEILLLDLARNKDKQAVVYELQPGLPVYYVVVDRTALEDGDEK